MVTRCVCHDVSFQQVRALRDRGMTFDEISAATKCCTGCGTCRAYVKIVIATGRVVLPVLSAEQVRRIEAGEVR